MSSPSPSSQREHRCPAPGAPQPAPSCGVDGPKDDGFTALHLAALNNHLEAAQALLQHVREGGGGGGEGWREGEREGGWAGRREGG